MGHNLESPADVHATCVRCRPFCGGRLYPKVCHFPRPEAVPAAAVNAALGWIVVRMTELLMKSATVELGAYAHPRAAPLLEAGAGPVNPGGHARRLALAVRSADGRIRKLAGPLRPAITPG